MLKTSFPGLRNKRVACIVLLIVLVIFSFVKVSHAFFTFYQNNQGLGTLLNDQGFLALILSFSKNNMNASLSGI